VKNSSLLISLIFTLLIMSFLACKKDGLNSPLAKKIQYRWESSSSAYTTDYLDGRPLIWTVRQSSPGYYTQFDNDGSMYNIFPSFTSKYYYKVDNDKILSLVAAPTRPTTPQYTDTSFIRYVNDTLLVLYKRKYFSSGAYAYIDESIDSLKK
jgi:hypothetical protein